MHDPLSTLVFDLDGTLYMNMELGREINRVACEYLGELKGIGADEAGLLVRQAKARLSFESGFDTPLSLACCDLGGDIVELHRRFAAQVRPERFLARDERVVELVHLLADRFDLYIYTNNNRKLADEIVGILGLAGFFDEVFSIDYTWRPKPHQETVERLLREIGRKPAECLFVGDRYDIDLRIPAAIGCGIFLVGGMEELLQLGTLLNEENL
jgi:putative hydrolase of the HAD superfamily